MSIPIYCHSNKVDELALYCPDVVPLVRPFEDAPFSPIDGLKCDPIQFAHDRLGSHGFVVDGFRYRVGYATDFGHVPPYLFDRFRDLDCIALESNYDPQTQADSARPVFVKRRITGGCGVVMHAIARTLCGSFSSVITGSHHAFTLAQQYERSPWLGRADRTRLIGEQLAFKFGPASLQIDGSNIGSKRFLGFR